MLIKAFFLIVKYWKQYRYPSVSEQLNKFCYIQTMEYYSALKKEGTINTWNNLDGHQGHYAPFFVLKSEAQKGAYCMIPFK